MGKNAEQAVSSEAAPLRHAAYAAIVRIDPSTQQQQFLVCLNGLSHKWTFPGGGQKKEDRSQNGEKFDEKIAIKRTLIREVSEEIGIVLRLKQAKSFLTGRTDDGRGGEQISHFYVVYQEDLQPHQVPHAVDEMENLDWVTEDQAQQMVDDGKMDEFILLGIKHIRLHTDRNERPRRSAPQAA